MRLVSAGGTLYTDEETTLITGNKSIVGTVFEDDGGTTGTPLDGIFNGDEAGMGNVGITLHLDQNSDGLIDSGDFLWGTIDSSTVDGSYSFAELPDGDYIVQVTRDDADRTTGYLLTTEEFYTVVIAGASSSGNDFGFGPILDVDKELVGTDPIYEGDLVTYTIDVSNLLEGDGSGGGTGGVEYSNEQMQTGYVASAPGQGSNFSNPGNAAGAPNTTVATAVPSSNGGQATKTLIGIQPTGFVQQDSLVGAELLFYLSLSGPLTDDTAQFEVSLDGGSNWYNIATLSAAELNGYVGAIGELALDITASGITWADLTSDAANTRARITYQSQNGTDNVTMSVDSIGYRATTAVITVDPDTASLIFTDAASDIKSVVPDEPPTLSTLTTELTPENIAVDHINGRV